MLIDNPYDDYQDMSFDLSCDITTQDNTYMIDGKTFSDITGSKIDYPTSDTIKISNQSATITLSNNTSIIRLDNENIDIMSEDVQIVDNNVMFPLEDVAVSLGYNVKVTDDSISLSRPYQSKRLIVKSTSPLDNYGAIKYVEGYNDIHIYQYSSEEKMLSAYDYYNSLSCVDYVEIDEIITTSSLSENTDTYGLEDSFSYKSWGADSMGVQDYSQYLLDNSSENLSEVIVAVLDTGLDSDHAWFQDRIADGGANYSSSESSTSFEWEDVYGHGTHVSGIIVDLTLSNVKILPIKVMNDDGYGYQSSILMGMYYVIELQEEQKNIYAMNMSLGGSGSTTSTEHTSYAQAIESAYNNGILTIVASGNDGEDVSNSVPANVTQAITVSAVGKIGSTYYRPSWSNYGNYVDICAPGYQICSACVGGGTVTMSGTSMATPHVSACVALLYSNPNKSYIIDDIEALLDNNAIDLGDEGWDIYFGEGMVNIKNAYATIIDSVTFSRTETTCTQSFDLELSTNILNAKIYYTLDGLEPTLTTGTLYTSPISISSTTIVKAIAYVLNDDNTIKSFSKTSSITYYFEGQDIENPYTISEDGTLIAYNGILTSITIPSQINGITLTTIGENAFSYTSVQNVTLPSTVTTIGSSAFYGCTTLISVSGENVTEIGMYAFLNCSNLSTLTGNQFPNLKSIGKYAFAYCSSISSINLSQVELVDYYAFYMGQTGNSTLSSITLDNCKIIGDMAFYNCNSLSTINLPKVEILGVGSFYSCNITNINLPKVNYIGTSSFYSNDNLLSVNMPSVLVIGSASFYNASKLHTAYIPNVQIIGGNAFYNCSQLSNITMDNICEVFEMAFSGCSFTQLNATNLKYIGRRAFYQGKLTSVNIPNVESIGLYAFANNTNLEEVSLSSCIERIDLDAFQYVSDTCKFYIYSGTIAEKYVQDSGYAYTSLSPQTSLFSFIITNGEVCITGVNEDNENLIIPTYIEGLPVTKIGDNAFKNYLGLKTINIPTLIEIEANAFQNCTNLQTITLNNISGIGDSAFEGCVNLQTIEISNVHHVGDKSFYNCSSLLEVKLSNNIESIGQMAFGLNNNKKILSFTIFGYEGTKAQEYANANDIDFNCIFNNLTHFYYNTYTNNGNTEIYISFVDSYITGNIIIPSSYNGVVISKIGDGAFENCCFVTSIILPQTITTIGAGAFKNCTLLNSINLSNITSLEVGDYGTFFNCVSLKEVSMPIITEIPAYTFIYCEGLVNVNIPKVKTIGTYAFFECYSLVNVTCPLVEELGYASFAYNINLKHIDTYNITTLGTSSNGSILGNVFTNCQELTEIYLPNIVTIGDSTFSSKTTKIVIGKYWTTTSGTPFDTTPTIYGYSGSYAETIAKSNGNTFVAINPLAISQNLSTYKKVNQFDEEVLEIVATGFEESYQWYSTTSTIDNGIAIYGATSNTLILDTTKIGTVNYYVVITDWNFDTITSNICSIETSATNKYCKITATSSAGGSITPEGISNILPDGEALYTFTPDLGYKIKDVIVNGESVGAVTSYTFSSITTDQTIHVDFELLTFDINISINGHGQTNTNATLQEVCFGEARYLTITPDNGWELSEVYINGESVEISDGAIELININQEMNIEIVFSPVENNTSNLLPIIIVICILILSLTLFSLNTIPHLKSNKKL